MAKEISGRERRRSREKGNQGVGGFRFMIFYNCALSFFSILFVPTTFTHTHDPRPTVFSYTRSGLARLGWSGLVGLGLISTCWSGLIWLVGWAWTEPFGLGWAVLAGQACSGLGRPGWSGLGRPGWLGLVGLGWCGLVGLGVIRGLAWLGLSWTC